MHLQENHIKIVSERTFKQTCIFMLMTVLGKHSVSKAESQGSVWFTSRLVAKRTTFGFQLIFLSLNPTLESIIILANFLAKTFFPPSIPKNLLGIGTYSFNYQDKNHTKMPGEEKRTLDTFSGQEELGLVLLIGPGSQNSLSTL